MVDFSAGYNATWGNSYDRPIKKLPPRVFPGGHPLYDEAEWLRGYDAGLEAGVHWKAGRAAGLANEPYDKSKPEAWRSGHYEGRVAWLRKQLLPILKQAGRLGLVALKVAYGDHNHITGETFEGGETYEMLTKRELLNDCVEYFMGRYVNTRDRYDCFAYVYNRVLTCEEVAAAVEAATRAAVFQERLTQQLADRLCCRVKTRGRHRAGNILTTCICEPRFAARVVSAADATPLVGKVT